MTQFFRILINDPTPLGRWKKKNSYPSVPNDNLAYHICLQVAHQKKVCFYQAEVQPVSPCPCCQGAKFVVMAGPDLGTMAISHFRLCPNCDGTGYAL